MGILLILILSPFVKASEYDVSVYSQDKFDIYQITINNCTTSFKIKKEESTYLKDNVKAIKDMVLTSSERAKHGCK